MFSLPAYAAILGMWILAAFPDARLLPPEKLAPDTISLLFLFAAFSLAGFPKWRARFLEHREAATFLALAALVLLFHLADRGGPRQGWAITLPFAPDDPVFVSFAARIVVAGAVLSLPAAIKNGGASERSFLLGAIGLGVLGVATLFFLGRFFSVGLQGQLNPAPTAQLLVQIVPFAGLALLARAITQNEKQCAWVLKIAPVLLLMTWARHQFSPVLGPMEDA